MQFNSAMTFHDQLQEYEFILGSQSPQRLKIVKEQLQIPNVQVVVSNYAEDLLKDGRTNEEYVLETCRKKAECILEQQRDAKRRVILCCDTIITCGGKIFEKPANSDDHLKMFETYKKFGVLTSITAVTLIKVEADGTFVEKCQTESTSLNFDFGSDELVSFYILSGEGSTAAGGFKIQGLGNVFFPSIEGDYSSVTGLPVYSTFKMLDSLFLKD